jgi:hypothetical protein
MRGGSGVHQRPDWVKEWIANKGQYVTLECGHREDLKNRTLMIKVFGGNDKAVWCYDCEDMSTVVKAIGLYEYHFGYPAPAIPDNPLF